MVVNLLQFTISEVSEKQDSSLLNNPPEAEQFYISLHCKFETLRLRSAVGGLPKKSSIRTRNPVFDFFRDLISFFVLPSMHIGYNNQLPRSR